MILMIEIPHGDSDGHGDDGDGDDNDDDENDHLQGQA